jgi:hypothetical protein
MSIGMLLLIVLAVMFFGSLPNWGYHRYGYAPSGALGTILVIIVILVLLGHL